MLVLTRKKNETIVIDGSILVTIVDVDGERVKVGIRAPKEISIYRKELLDAVAAENRSASSAKPEDLKNIMKLSPIKDKKK